MGFPGKNIGVGYCFLLQGIFGCRDGTWVSCVMGRTFNHLNHQGRDTDLS